MIPQSTFDQLQDEDTLDPNKFLVPGSGSKQLAHWNNQGLQDDSVWIMTAAFTMFTMTSGYGLLESGRVSSKDEVNIMVKNVVDVVLGGLSYWMFGFGLTYGSGETYIKSFVGFGEFFFDPNYPDDSTEGWTYASFVYQMSFATTTSAIISGMAERVGMKAYLVVAFLMPLVHAIPAHWIWSEDGILWKIGVIDSAGCSAVHLVGGVSGLIATVYLRPRRRRFGKGGRKQMSNPTNAVLGSFMLWWGWMSFNAGSTYGVSHGKWKLAARAGVSTLLASIGGGLASLVVSLALEGKVLIDMLIDGLLAALVASTAGCACMVPYESFVVGALGAMFALCCYPLLEWTEIDDPVGVVPVHVVGAVWGMLAAGIFANDDPYNFEVTRNQSGILAGGGFSLMINQMIAIAAVSLWSGLIGFLILFNLYAIWTWFSLVNLLIMLTKVAAARAISTLMVYVVKWRMKARLGAARRKLIRMKKESEQEQEAERGTGVVVREGARPREGRGNEPGAESELDQTSTHGVNSDLRFRGAIIPVMEISTVD